MVGLSANNSSEESWVSFTQEKPKGDVQPVLKMQNVSAEKERANHLPCPLGVKEEAVRLIGSRDRGEKAGLCRSLWKQL